LLDAEGTIDMVKIATLLMRSLARVGKVQRRTVNKLFNHLLGQPVVKPRPKPRPASKVTPRILANTAVKSISRGAAKARPKAVPRVAAKTALKSALTVKAALKSQAKPVARTRARSAALPGKWLAAHYSSLPQLGTLVGRRMSYWLYLPDKVASVASVPAAAPARGLPLIVMLHGCGQSATQFAQGTRMNRLAEQQGYAVLYPQQSLTSHVHRCWKWYDKATQQGGGDVAMIVGIILQVAHKHGIDRSRIYIAGVSAGAGMADIIALNHPELIAAVGLHSGPVFGGGHSTMGALNLMQHGDQASSEGAIADILERKPEFPQMPKILIQGMQDKVVDPVNQRQLLQQGLRLNRLESEIQAPAQQTPATAAGSRKPAHGYATSDYYGEKVDGEKVGAEKRAAGKVAGQTLLLRVAQIEQLDHAWSGGDASLPFNEKNGPDASKMMLDFFALHRRL
jgi:poly(hydroxyalkanoate) depolymerase family esterase